MPMVRLTQPEPREFEDYEPVDPACEDDDDSIPVNLNWPDWLKEAAPLVDFVNNHFKE